MDLFIQVSGAVFGVSASVLLCGGWLLLRWQRNQHRFQLMHTAIERGAATIPLGPPSWIVSLRRGVVILALGVGLMLLGGGAYLVAARAPSPPGSGSADGAPATESNPSVQLETDRQSENLRPAEPTRPFDYKAWHRAQLLGTCGLMCLGCGLVLALLGATSAVFAVRVEKHATTFEEQLTIPAEVEAEAAQPTMGPTE